MNTRDLSLATVVVPCFNHGHYLRASLESILVQTYPNWEAIIVDDGSTDDTAAVAASVTDPRIRYIYQMNQGLSAARNTGIQYALGDYVAFLDADDTWMPQFLERCLTVLRRDNSLIGVYTLNDFIDQDGKALPQSGGEIVESSRFHERCLLGGFFPVHAALVRKDLVQAVGGFDTELRSEEDWDFWLRISKRGKMVGIPEPLAHYRLVSSSMSTNAARMHESGLTVLQKYFGAVDNTEPKAWTVEKRLAYGYAYRSGALRYIQQTDEEQGLALLAQAVRIWPRLLSQTDTYYELAFANQPMGYRGQAQILDLVETPKRILQQHKWVMAAAGADLQSYRRSSLAYLFLTLAMLSDQAGDWFAARSYLWRALRYHPAFLGSPPVMRRLSKVCAGKRAVELARRLLGRDVATTIPLEDKRCASSF